MSGPEEGYHVGDSGVKIHVHFQTRLNPGELPARYEDRDVSGAVLSFVIQRPDRTIVEVADADLLPSDLPGSPGDRTDGRVMYVVAPGVLSLSGRYETQAREVGGGLDVRAFVDAFTVHPSLGVVA